jgi:hypothetical protein
MGGAAIDSLRNCNYVISPRVRWVSPTNSHRLLAYKGVCGGQPNEALFHRPQTLETFCWLRSLLEFYVIKPLVKDLVPNLRQCSAMAGHILADKVWINFRFAKFNRMANQPGFDPLRVSFDVELNCEQIWTFLERLTRAMNGGGKILAERRQVEIVTMPVKDRQAFEVPEKTRASDGR